VEAEAETSAPNSASSAALCFWYADSKLESGEWTPEHHLRTCARMQNYLQFAGFENASPADSQNRLVAKALIQPFFATIGAR
jgi:hypothetical protein